MEFLKNPSDFSWDNILYTYFTILIFEKYLKKTAKVGFSL